MSAKSKSLNWEEGLQQAKEKLTMNGQKKTRKSRKKITPRRGTKSLLAAARTTIAKHKLTNQDAANFSISPAIFYKVKNNKTEYLQFSTEDKLRNLVAFYQHIEPEPVEGKDEEQLQLPLDPAPSREPMVMTNLGDEWSTIQEANTSLQRKVDTLSKQLAALEQDLANKDAVCQAQERSLLDSEARRVEMVQAHTKEVNNLNRKLHKLIDAL